MSGDVIEGGWTHVVDTCGAARFDQYGHKVATCSAHLHPYGTDHYDRDTGAVWNGEQELRVPIERPDPRQIVRDVLTGWPLGVGTTEYGVTMVSCADAPLMADAVIAALRAHLKGGA